MLNKGHFVSFDIIEHPWTFSPQSDGLSGRTGLVGDGSRSAGAARVRIASSSGVRVGVFSTIAMRLSRGVFISA